MSEPTPAGWYPDPENSTQQRYWDGGAWTEQFAPANATAIPVATATKKPFYKRAWFLVLAVLVPMTLFVGSLVLAGTLVAVAPHLIPYGDIEPPDRAMAPHEFVEPDEPVPNDDMREREVASLVEKAATAGFEEAGTSLDELDPDFGPHRWDRFLVSQNLVIVNTSLENTRKGRSTAGRIAQVIRGRLVDNHWDVDTLQVIAADGTVLKAVDFPTQPR